MKKLRGEKLQEKTTGGNLMLGRDGLGNFLARSRFVVSMGFFV